MKKQKLGKPKKPMSLDEWCEKSGKAYEYAEENNPFEYLENEDLSEYIEKDLIPSTFAQLKDYKE